MRPLLWPRRPQSGGAERDGINLSNLGRRASNERRRVIVGAARGTSVSLATGATLNTQESGAHFRP